MGKGSQRRPTQVSDDEFKSNWERTFRVEEWRTIPGQDPRYEVSNLGRVRSWFIPGGDVRNPAKMALRRARTPRFLKPGVASHGYPTVVLRKGNTQCVHTLVASAFLGPCPDGQEVRHIDGSRTNNDQDNLEYGSRSDNIRDAIAHGSLV